MSKFEIKVNQTGVGEFHLNGIDISNLIRGFNLFTSVGKSTQIDVNMSGDVEIEGDANITLILPEGRKFQVKDK